MNNHLIEEIRKAIEKMNTETLSVVARYQQDYSKTDEGLVEDIEASIDRLKATLSDLKGKVQEGIL